VSKSKNEPRLITRTKLNACPHCGKTIDSASTPDRGSDYKPEPGDASLCFGCGEWCMFQDDLTLRKPSEEELIEIGLDPDCRRVRQAWVLLQYEIIGSVSKAGRLF
jgi:hypothetical protein